MRGEKINDNVSGEQPVFVAYPACPDDELSLLDIWRVLWRNKTLITGMIFVSILLATVVAFSLPKIYQAEIILEPSSASDIARLNIAEIYEVDSKSVYAEFVNNLRDRGVRYQFFKSNYLKMEQGGNSKKERADYVLSEKKFEKLIRISSKGKNPIVGSVTIEGENAASISRWLNGYIKFVDDYTVQGIIDDIQEKISITVINLEEGIDSLRLLAKQHRLDRISQLKDAITIAKKADIRESLGIPLVLNNRVDCGKENATISSANISGTQEYYKGYLVLQAELNQLQIRKNDDPFIPGLRDLQGRIVFLEKKHIRPDKIHAVKVDLQAIANNNPISPRRFLIILMGGILGTMVGVFSVFIKNVFDKEQLGES